MSQPRDIAQEGHYDNRRHHQGAVGHSHSASASSINSPFRAGTPPLRAGAPAQSYSTHSPQHNTSQAEGRPMSQPVPGNYQLPQAYQHTQGENRIDNQSLHGRTYRVNQLAERNILLEEEKEEVRSKDGRTAVEIDGDCHQRHSGPQEDNRSQGRPAANNVIEDGQFGNRRPKNPTAVLRLAVEERDLMKDHSSYHQSIPGDEAIRRLKLSGENRCYLTRYSEEQKSYVLTVYMKQTPVDVENHFRITLDQDRKHTVEGIAKSFDEIEELLQHFKRHRIDRSLKDIGVEYSEERYLKKIQPRKCTLL